jgi:hypothetical protein
MGRAGAGGRGKGRGGAGAAAGARRGRGRAKGRGKGKPRTASPHGTRGIAAVAPRFDPGAANRRDAHSENIV